MYTTNQPIGSTVDNYDITSPSIKRYNNMKNQTNTRKRVEEIMEEFVEKGANLEHDRWARWQKYMFSKCKKHILSQALSQQLNEIKGKVEGMKITEKKGVIEMIFGNAKKKKMRLHTNMDVGYNQAIDDILAIIDSMK